MPPKRKRVDTGLAAGEHLKRNKLAGADYLNWDWVGTEVTDVTGITHAHRLAAYGFASSNRRCPNKYAKPEREKSQSPREGSDGELIVVEDGPLRVCDRQTCKKNPGCLNYLGQERWENAKSARQALLKLTKSEEDPRDKSRENGEPVGLMNLGATCYANAYLQVWFRNLPFRSGVYSCTGGELDGEENSSIFQLQVIFAALQKSNQRVYNPIKLMESLKLRSEVQQDAQEFSKLFMSHLDYEFRSERHPALRTLIPSQFQGTQAYGTMCHGCKTCSEHISEFYELEVNLTPDAKLEDTLINLLAKETLSGDNKYFCSNCSLHQDATRYTELRQLPPVLHISLLRFVFDIKTFERKKSKHAITFPTIVDMSPFMKPTNTAIEQEEATNVYHLRGVLLHKGASAYHGHYITQVYDVMDGCWYECNDELVTRIDDLGSDALTGKSNMRHNALKPGTLPENGRAAQTPVFKSKLVTSKDAYMLIYAQGPPPTTESSVRASAAMASKEPPDRAYNIIKKANDAHSQKIEEFVNRQEGMLKLYDLVRAHRMDVYQSWHCSEDFNRVVSRQALETWLTLPMKAPAKPGPNDSEALPQLPCGPSIAKGGPENVEYLPCDIPVSEIVCPHGRLDPRRASDMKRIPSNLFVDHITNCSFVPCLTIDDVCVPCVDEIFEERLYNQRHPEHVKRFDELCSSGMQDIDTSFYISKRWVKDWRLTKPKLRISKARDIPPDDEEFCGEVKCEHGGLAPGASSTAQLISLEAHEFLLSLFPSWQTLTRNAEVCGECAGAFYEHKEGRRDASREGAAEKALLRALFEDTLDDLKYARDTPCALVPSEFVRQWRQWVSRPANTSRPTQIDTGIFVCEHGMLNVDPNLPLDMESSHLSVIRLSDWDALKERYETGPLISLTNASMEGGNEGINSVWNCETATCQPCGASRYGFLLH